MKKKKLMIAVGTVGALAAFTTLQGCSQKSNHSTPEKTETVSQALASKLHVDAQKLRAEGKASEAIAVDKEAAAHYARLGELLLMPEGMEYADEMFAKALAIDPNNAKALIYKAGTEPLMTLRGYIPRVE